MKELELLESAQNDPTMTVVDAVNTVMVDFKVWDEQLEDDLLSLCVEDDESGAIEMPMAPENDLPVPKVPFGYLRKITAHFGDLDPGRKIGSGGFADVYLGITQVRKN